jgi:catechol 2,3-dioxygenase-like lactoylglutathione lyase family enzyme
MADNGAIKFTGVHHLALVCRDMERTVEFYTNVLEMKLVKGFDLDGGYGQHFFFDMGGGGLLAFFWFRDAPDALPGTTSAAHLVGSRDGTISSAASSMNHVAFNVAADEIEAYRDKLVDRGVECTSVVNHDDVVTGDEARTAKEINAKTWLRSFYFFDPDGIMLEFCANLAAGSGHVEAPVNAEGIKANGQPITGAV